jgi:hypothetical protein
MGLILQKLSNNLNYYSRSTAFKIIMLIWVIILGEG